MTRTPQSFEPDEDEIANKTPAACPFCEQSSAFDGQGTKTEIMKTVSDGESVVYEATWTEIRCPMCNGTFRMRDSVVPIDGGWA